jgi:uncharacterized protein
MQQSNTQIDKKPALLFNITSPEGKESHLFATCHLKNKDLLQIDKATLDAFSSAKRVVIEANLDDKKPYIFDAWANLSAKHDLPNDYIKAASQLLSRLQSLKENYHDSTIMADVLESLIKLYPPMFLIQLYLAEIYQLAMVNDSQLFLDETILHVAKKANKKISFLEEKNEQLSVISATDYSLDEQITLFNEYLKAIAQNSLAANAKDIVAAYLKGDLASLDDLSANDNLIDPSPLVMSYCDAIYSLRDKKMANGMKEALGEGDAFIAVGAAHINGIIARLSRQGYVIKAVTLGEKTHGFEKSASLNLSAFSNLLFLGPKLIKNTFEGVASIFYPSASI